MTQAPRTSASTDVLAGLVERVTFRNAENGFCALRVEASGQRDLITVLGHAAVISPAVRPGERNLGQRPRARRPIQSCVPQRGVICGAHGPRSELRDPVRTWSPDAVAKALLSDDRPWPTPRLSQGKERRSVGCPLVRGHRPLPERCVPAPRALPPVCRSKRGPTPSNSASPSI